MSNPTVVVVTGVSSGIGRAAAEQFARRGCRVFGIRATLVEPSFTRTSLDVNAPRASAKIADYDRERTLAARAVVDNVKAAPEPDGVASTIVEAALGAWRMRRAPSGEASLLRTLRRFMPAGPVDSSLRKKFRLG
ncbi:SDR family NAD(P)-dependent oxidoreductase [Burkholderia sola]|uniref:SDR family NAD(P)-dependent oxidoreductase n=1 Tax=Burkholderia sola TaxID=2843302 RepID=UPI0033901762